MNFEQMKPGEPETINDYLDALMQLDREQADYEIRKAEIIAKLNELKKKMDYEKAEGLDKGEASDFHEVSRHMDDLVNFELRADSKEDLEKRKASARARYKDVLREILGDQSRRGERLRWPNKPTPEQDAVSDSFINFFGYGDPQMEVFDEVEEELKSQYSETNK